MALRAVIDHPKFARLKALLKLNKACTLGYLEGLWHFCGRYTPQGNIGKYTDQDIEAWLEWDGEEGALIEALVKSRWIDIHPEHRLVVHDWHCHADDATRKALGRAKLDFLTRNEGQVEEVSGQCRDSVGTPEGLPEPVPVITVANATGEKPPEASKDDPFSRAERVVASAFLALEWPPPVPADVRKHLKADSPIQVLISQFGEETSSSLFVLAARTWTHKPTWKAVCDQRNQLYDQLKGRKSGKTESRPMDYALLEVAA